MEHLILSPFCLTLPVYWYCTLCKVFLFFCCLELSSLGRFRPFSKISKIPPPPFSDLNFVTYLPALSHVQMWIKILVLTRGIYCTFWSPPPKKKYTFRFIAIFTFFHSLLSIFLSLYFFFYFFCQWPIL